jgi:hypothetical protein
VLSTVPNSMIFVSESRIGRNTPNGKHKINTTYNNTNKKIIKEKENNKK